MKVNILTNIDNIKNLNNKVSIFNLLKKQKLYIIKIDCAYCASYFN